MTQAIPEAEIEGRIMSALSRTGIAAQIVGAWAIANSGGVKNLEEVAPPAVVSVGVALRRYDTAQIPTAEIPFTIGVSVREDADPTGELFAQTCAAIADVLQRWQDSIFAAERELSVAGADVGGFRMDGGESPTRGDEAWNCYFNATVIAVLNRNENNNQTERNG